MKKCKECKEEVSNANWSYRDKLCKRCGARKKYRETHPEAQQRIILTKKSSKEDLIKIIHLRNMSINRLSNIINGKNQQIRCFRLRMLKMRNSLDYLLEHPFALDTTNRTSSHKRDGISLTHRTGSLKRIRRGKNESR